MVGNCGTPSWSDTAVAYLTFYHLLAKGRLIPEAVAAMSAASGDSRWLVETADESKQGYIEFLKLQTTPAQIQPQLETAASQEPLPATAKALEAGTGAEHPNGAVAPNVLCHHVAEARGSFGALGSRHRPRPPKPG